MHQSAYNLLYQRFYYENLDINKDSLMLTLSKEEINQDTAHYRNVFIINTSK